MAIAEIRLFLHPPDFGCGLLCAWPCICTPGGTERSQEPSVWGRRLERRQDYHSLQCEVKSSECVRGRGAQRLGFRSRRNSFWVGRLHRYFEFGRRALDLGGKSELGKGGAGVERSPKGQDLRGQRCGGLGTSCARLTVGQIKVNGETSRGEGALGAGLAGRSPCMRSCLSCWQT